MSCPIEHIRQAILATEVRQNLEVEKLTKLREKAVANYDYAQAGIYDLQIRTWQSALLDTQALRVEIEEPQMTDKAA